MASRVISGLFCLLIVPMLRGDPVGPERTAGPVQLMQPVPHQVVQRRTRDDGLIPVAGTFPGGGPVPVGMEVRWVGERVAGDWIPVRTAGEGGAFRAELVAPAGGWYRVQVRGFGPDPEAVDAETGPVGVGEIFVVAGQSNSANHGEERQVTRTGRVAAWDGGTWRLCVDPQPGASGDGGSFLPPLGDILVERLGVPVGFVACGIGATSVREWLPRGATFPEPPTLEGRVERLPDGRWASRGEAYARLVERMRPLGPRGFRAVLWHQGESDANQKDPTRTLPGPLYREFLERVIRDSRRDVGWEVPWFVARASYHVPGDEGSPEIRAAQASLWRDGVALEGPDSDALKGNLRDAGGQGVHFSGEGLRAHAAVWAERILPWLQAQDR